MAPTKTVLTALAVLAAAAPAASADTLQTAAPGARNLDQGAGYQVWAAPADEPDEDRWELVVRAPDGSVRTPDGLATFGAPPDPVVAATRAAGSPRPVPYAVYARCAGTSTTRGCDVLRLDLRSGRETRVAVAATRARSETAPAASGDVLTFVRAGDGLYAANLRRGTAARRIARTASPVETRTNGTRVAYAAGGQVVVRRLSRPGVDVQRFRGGTNPRSLLLDRYRVSWLADGGRTFLSGRFGGSGDPATDVVEAADRTLPPTTQSIASLGDRLRLYLDDEGVKRVAPQLFRSE